MTGSGGYFTKLGHIGMGLNDANALRGGSATKDGIVTDVASAGNMSTRFLTTLVADYAAGTAIPQVIDGINGQLTNFQQAIGSVLGYLKTLAQNTLITMANNDTPLANPNLQSAVSLLVAQMLSSGAHLAAGSFSVGAQTNGIATPTGNPVIVMSLLNPQGLISQYIYLETLTFSCIADSYTGGATAGQETLLVTSPAPITDVLAYNWPGTSGVTQSLRAIDGYVSNQGGFGNMMVNSGFQSFTSSANLPDNWTAVTGTVGTQIVAGGSSNSYAGTNSLGFVGDSATLTAIKQQFTTVASKISPLSVYCVNFWYKLSSASPAAGVLRVRLVDGVGATINNAQAVANSKTTTLSAVGDTSWHNVNAIFETPAILPTTGVFLQVELSTALTTGTTVYVDLLAFANMMQLYNPVGVGGGPNCCIFRGSTKMVVNDTWTITTSGTYGAMQNLAWRMLNLPSYGVQIGYSGGGTSVLDSLII